MNFKNLSYIKKQNKTILTKNKTKREGKEQKKRREEKKTGFGRNRTQDLLHASQIRYYYAT